MTAVPPSLPSETSHSAPPQQNGTVSHAPLKDSKLPKLPLPKLEDTCKRYLRALEGLQNPEEHQRTREIVNEFLASGEGEKWQKRLEEYNETKESYIEEFWCEFFGGWRRLICR